MHFTVSLGLGLAVGIGNWLFWRGSVRRLIKTRSKSWLWLLSPLKLGLLAAVIWVLLDQFELDPIGFLVGFSITIVWTLMRGLEWN